MLISFGVIVSLLKVNGCVLFLRNCSVECVCIDFMGCIVCLCLLGI